MSVTLQQLAYFVAVADVRSFTRAAESLGVAQPTLSRQLRALEDELGAPLLDRGGRDGPVLTPAGEAALPLARRVLADSHSARPAGPCRTRTARGRRWPRSSGCAAAGCGWAPRRRCASGCWPTCCASSTPSTRGSPSNWSRTARRRWCAR